MIRDDFFPYPGSLKTSQNSIYIDEIFILIYQYPLRSSEKNEKFSVADPG
jgi:hypothetical protein